MSPAALELTGIRKRFGSVHALRGADFVVRPGEVHALLGENGAGKTTLMHVAYGLLRPEAGEVRVRGVVRSIRSPRAARAVGIGMVHQHFTSIPALTVAENVALFAGWPVEPGRVRRRVEALCDRVGLPLDPAEPAERLSAGLKQRLELVKALAADATVLLLDEPTAVLAPHEAHDLFRVIRRYADGGGAVVLITHKLSEALEWADRVTVLRRGEVVLSATASSLAPAELAAAMLGGAPAAIPQAKVAPRIGEVVVSARDLVVSRETGEGIAVNRASLAVHAGEVVGVAAIEGNGHRELLRAIAGRLRPSAGGLDVTGPVGFIPEDRTAEGLIPELSLSENLLLGAGADDPAVSGWRIRWSRADAHTDRLLRDFDIVADGPRARAATLSGGNQQRVVLARELSRRPRVVVAENPTRGLDLGATVAVHRRLREAAREGAAVLLHSSDLDEVIDLADRVVVMRHGLLLNVPDGSTRAETGTLMLGAP